MLADDVVRNPVADDTTTSTPTASPPTATYRPHLDGMRAIAVYLVVLFHAGSAQFSGGYIGVDVFFVLSGYLVTQLLLRDITARGSIQFGRFYARRFRRLLPAAFVVLIATAFIFTAIAAPADVINAVGSFKAAFLYVTNWYLIHSSTGYFGADISHNPVLHFWSLAVEEQFYLLWPLALGGMFLVTRRMDRDRQLRVIRTIVVVGALASAVWALSLRSTNPDRAYYGTDARAYELLAGALIALLPSIIAVAARYRRSTRVMTVVSVAAVIALATSWVHLDAIERGIAITIVTFVLIVSLEAADGGITQGALSTHAMTYLGKISYGTYLWHWIVILVIVTKFHVSVTATILLACLIATGLSALSFEILEHPVRRSARLNRHKGLVIATGLTVSVVSALVLIPRIVDPAQASAPGLRGATTAGFTPVPANLDWQHAKAGGAAVRRLSRQARERVHHRARDGQAHLPARRQPRLDAHSRVRGDRPPRQPHAVGISPGQLPLATRPLCVSGHREQDDAEHRRVSGAEGRHVHARHPGVASRSRRGHGGRP